MRGFKAVGAVLAVTCAAMACSDFPTTPTSVATTTSATTPTGGATPSPFAVNYKVTALPAANGTIAPSGVVSISAGATQMFRFTADPGYHVADVIVDGTSVGAPTSYTFTNVLADHTIQATFAADALVGLYSGSLLLTSAQNVLDGDCAGADISEIVGTPGALSSVTLTMTQNQNAVTAVLRSATNGLQCSYTGTTSGGFFSANAAACDAPVLNLQCTNTSPRLLALAGSTITGTIDGDTISGSVGTWYNVTGITGLIIQNTFNVTRR